MTATGDTRKAAKKEGRWMTTEERFWDKVFIDPENPNGCWEWTAGRSGKGRHYGSFWDGRHDVRAHRFAFELANGPIADGLQIDHLCRNRICVNPAHLEAVTPQENVLRGEGIAAHRARQTECHRGHPFDEANTYSRSDRTQRNCRVCRRIAQRKYRLGKKTEGANNV